MVLDWQALLSWLQEISALTCCALGRLAVAGREQLNRSHAGSHQGADRPWPDQRQPGPRTATVTAPFYKYNSHDSRLTSLKGRCMGNPKGSTRRCSVCPFVGTH